MTTFHQNLRWLRIQYHLYQVQVAQCVGVHPHTVSDWECGYYLPNAEQLARLREVFGDTALLDVELLAAHEERQRDQRNRKLQAKYR
jgi:transcriptional regulator with XRE-family HTH domain